MGLICLTGSSSGPAAVGVCETGMLLFQITRNVGVDVGNVEKRVRGAVGPVVGDLRWQDYVRQEMAKKKEGVQYKVNDRQGQSLLWKVPEMAYTRMTYVIERRSVGGRILLVQRDGTEQKGWRAGASWKSMDLQYVLEGNITPQSPRPAIVCLYLDI